MKSNSTDMTSSNYFCCFVVDYLHADNSECFRYISNFILTYEHKENIDI